jgi:hypothetical protein
MEATNGMQPAEISRVAIRLPPFWAERPAVWFAQAEAQFSLAGISNETTKFYYVISQLDHWYAAEVEDVITSPPQQDPYTKLRTELLKRLSLSREQCAQQLLTFEEMGDRKPSQFLRHLRASPRTCRTTSCTPSGPTGYPPNYGPLSPAIPRSSWTLRPSVQIASPRLFSRPRS